LDIAVVRAKITADDTNQPLLASNNNFHVKRERLTDDIRVPDRIDWDSLHSLPEDGTIFHRLRSIQQTEVEIASDDQLDPNDLYEDNDPTLNVTSNGFVPSLHSNESEVSALQNGLQLTEAILTMPTIHPAPINEHDQNRRYITEAFSNLFPTGRSDFHEDRLHNVSAPDYFKHLMRYCDGRFV
jgi:hypothetical protein